MQPPKKSTHTTSPVGGRQIIKSTHTTSPAGGRQIIKFKRFTSKGGKESHRYKFLSKGGKEGHQENELQIKRAKGTNLEGGLMVEIPPHIIFYVYVTIF